MAGKASVTVHRVLRPDELICSDGKSFDTSSLDALERDLLQKYLPFEKLSRSTEIPDEGWCTVRQSASECYRGYIFGKSTDRLSYEVFLCDHGSKRFFPRDQLLPLSTAHKKCLARYYIVKIYGIFPVASKLTKDNDWSKDAYEVAQRWIDSNAEQIKIQIKESRCDRLVRWGDLRTPCSENAFKWTTYSSYLVDHQVAVYSDGICYEGRVTPGQSKDAQVSNTEKKCPSPNVQDAAVEFERRPSDRVTQKVRQFRGKEPEKACTATELNGNRSLPGSTGCVNPAGPKNLDISNENLKSTKVATPVLSETIRNGCTLGTTTSSDQYSVEEKDDEDLLGDVEGLIPLGLQDTSEGGEPVYLNHKDKLLNMNSKLCNIMEREKAPVSVRKIAKAVEKTDNRAPISTPDLFERIKDPDGCFENMYDRLDPDIAKRFSLTSPHNNPPRPDSISFGDAPINPPKSQVTTVTVDTTKKTTNNSSPVTTTTSPLKSNVSPPQNKIRRPSGTSPTEFGRKKSTEDVRVKPPSMDVMGRDSVGKPKVSKRFGEAKHLSSNPFFTVQVVPGSSSHIRDTTGVGEKASAHRRTTRPTTPSGGENSFKSSLPSCLDIQTKVVQRDSEGGGARTSDGTLFSPKTAPTPPGAKSNSTPTFQDKGIRHATQTEADLWPTSAGLGVLERTYEKDSLQPIIRNKSALDNLFQRPAQASTKSPVILGRGRGHPNLTSTTREPSSAPLSSVHSSKTDRISTAVRSPSDGETSGISEMSSGISSSSPGKSHCYDSVAAKCSDIVLASSTVTAKPSHTTEVEVFRKMMQGRTFVFAQDRNSIAAPYSSLKDFPFYGDVSSFLAGHFKHFSSMQSNVIPNILLGKNVYIVGTRNTGKTLAYALPVTAKIIQINTSSVPRKRNEGPLAVILVGSIAKGDRLMDYLSGLIESKNYRQTTHYFVTQNDAKTRQELRGVDVLVTLPEVLEEMIDMYLPYFGFERLQYFIVDDMEINMTAKISVMESLLQKLAHGLTALSPRPCSTQYIFCGEVWTPAIEDSMNAVDDPVVFLGPFQASMFAGVKIKILYAEDQEEKIRQFLDVIKRMINSGGAVTKVIVVCKDNDTVRSVQRSIQDNCKVTATAAMHCSENDPNWNPGHIDAIRQKWDAASASSLQIVVCTDVVIKELGIVNATRVVHFDSCEILSVFSMRLSTMWQWYRSAKQSSMGKRRQQLVSYAFFTPEDQNLLKIAVRLQREGAEIPEKLEADLKKLKLAHENEAILCPALTRFGFCAEPDSCQCRHRILEKDLQLHHLIPPTGQVEVRITKVISLTCYHAQLLRHYKVSGGKTVLTHNYEEELKRRALFLESYYEKLENRVPIESFESRKCGAVRDENSNMYVRVKFDTQRSLNTTSQSVPLFCLDTGNVMHRKLSDIYILPEGYDDSLPGLCVELVVANVKPPLGEKKYRLSHLRDYYRKLQDCRLVGRICLTLNQRIWVDQLVEITSGASGRQMVKRSVRPDLFHLKYAENNPEHMKMLYGLLEDVGFSCKMYEKLEEQGHLGSEFQNLFYRRGDRVYWAHLPLSSTSNPESVDMRISMVRDADEVVAYQKKFAKQMYALITEMGTEIESLLVTGKYRNCAALEKYYDEDMVVAVKNRNCWERGLITRVHHREVGKPVLDVLLVDLGEELEELNVSDVHPIPSKYVERLPFQAITLKMTHIVPRGDRVWSSKAFDLVCENAFVNYKEADIDALAYKRLDNVGNTRGNYYAALIYVVSQEFELADKLVLERFASVSDKDEPLIKELKAAFLKKLSDEVDEALRAGENHEEDEDSEEAKGVSHNGQFEDDGSDLDRWDFGCSSDFDAMKEIFGIETAKLKGETVDVKSTSALTPPERESSVRVEEVNDEDDGAVISSGSLQITHPVNAPPPPDADLKKPSTTWKQTEDEIFLSVDLPDVKQFEARVENRRYLIFETKNPEGYGFHLRLFKFVEEKIHVEALGARVKIKLSKRMRLNWKRLTQDENKFRWLKQDYYFASSSNSDGESGSDIDGAGLCSKKPKSKTHKRIRSYIPVKYESDESSSDFQDCRDSEFDAGMISD